MAGGQERADFAHGQDVLNILNRDLANEMNTMLMYMADSLLVRGSDSFNVKSVASQFADQDFSHVKRIAARIVELDGTPQLMPAQIQDNATIDMQMPTRAEHGEAKPMLKNALENELQSVIEYKNQVQNIGFTDPTTRLLLEEILADKEHQAEQIRDLLGL